MTFNTVFPPRQQCLVCLLVNLFAYYSRQWYPRYNSLKRRSWLTGNEAKARREPQSSCCAPLRISAKKRKGKWMTFIGLAMRLILMVDLKTVRKWKSPRSSSGFASQSVILDSNTSLDCEHEISPSDTHHRQAERDKIASALSAGNQSVELTRWRWCFTPLYAALFCLSRLLIRFSIQVLTTVSRVQKAALIKSRTFCFLGDSHPDLRGR